MAEINKYIGTGIAFPNTLKETGNQPLDARVVCSKFSDVTAASGTSKKSVWTGVGIYPGMVMVDQETGAMYALKKDATDTVHGAKVPWLADSWKRVDVDAYNLPVASASVLGGIKLGYTQSGKDYPIELDVNNKAYVYVPWTDTVYTHPTYAAKTAGETADKTLTYGGTFKIPYLVSDTQGHVGASTKEITLTMPAAPAAPGDGKLSFKVGTTEVASFTANQATGTDATFSIAAGSNITVTPDATNHKVTIANTYSYSLPSATSSILGGVKLGSDDVQAVAASTPSSAAGRTYPIQVNSSGQMVVNVPWTDTPVTWEGE